MNRLRILLASLVFACTTACAPTACAPEQPDLSVQIADWCDMHHKTGGTRTCRWAENVHAGYYLVATYRCDVQGVGDEVHALTCNGACTLARGVMQ